MRGWVQGRVIFSLRELEKGETWYTENRNSVRRISDTHVLLGGTNHTTHGAVYTTTLPTHTPRRHHHASHCRSTWLCSLALTEYASRAYVRTCAQRPSSWPSPRRRTLM